MKSLLVLLALWCASAFAQTCQFKGSISGKTYDFTKLKNDANDWSVDVPQGPSVQIAYTVKMNLCRALVTTQCNEQGTDLGACQLWPTPAFTYQAPLGQATGAQFAEAKTSGDDGFGGTLTFTGSANQAVINFICAKNVETGAPTFVSKTNGNTFNFEWKTKQACPNGGGGGGGGGSGGKKGLSAGSVMLIILLVVVVVYFVGGILFQKFVRHAEGGDVVPNRQFWGELPLLVRDGFRFIIGKISGKSSSYQSV